MSNLFKWTEITRNFIYIVLIIGSVILTQILAFNDSRRDIQELKTRLNPTVKDSYAERIIENSATIQELKLLSEKLTYQCMQSEKEQDELAEAIRSLNLILIEMRGAK